MEPGMKQNKPRVIVIGLDGATFTNLKPWMDEGLLPNLKFLMENGVSGELESTMPRHSSLAWTSFMTGVNPGKHGIFGFIKPFKDKSYKNELVSSRDIRSRTIFEMLSENAKVVCSVNLPLTYPPFKINGAMISCGLLTPGTDFDFTYPEDLFEKIGFKKEDYILNISSMRYPKDKEKFFQDLVKCTKIRKEISFKIMENFNWDLFMVVFSETDWLQHFFWQCIDPTHSKYNQEDSKRFSPFVVDYYQKLDVVIGEFLNYVDEKTTLLIISDHGFGPREKTISFHKLLHQNGLLHYKKENLLERFNGVQHKVRGTLDKRSQVYRKVKAALKLIYAKSRGV